MCQEGKSTMCTTPIKLVPYTCQGDLTVQSEVPMAVPLYPLAGPFLPQIDLFLLPSVHPTDAFLLAPAMAHSSYGQTDNKECLRNLIFLNSDMKLISATECTLWTFS